MALVHISLIHNVHNINEIHKIVNKNSQLLLLLLAPTVLSLFNLAKILGICFVFIDKFKQKEQEEKSKECENDSYIKNREYQGKLF